MKKPDELVVLSWRGGWGKALARAVSAPFERLTGIRVRHEPNVGLQIPESLVAALERRERTHCHVVWAHSVASLHMASRGFCSRLAERVADSQDLDPRARPRTHGDVVVFPYVVYYVLAYREGAFHRGPPDTWEVMLDRRFAQKVALYPGGNGFYAVAQLLGGGRLSDIPVEMGPCWKCFELLRPQVALLDYSVGTMAHALASGAIDLCFRALTNALAFRAEGLPVSWAFPREGVPDTTDALWIPEGLEPHTSYWANRYIEFALSAPVQTHWCMLLGTMPMNRRAMVPPLFADASGLPKGPSDKTGVLHIPDEVRLAYETAWAAKFDSLFLH